MLADIPVTMTGPAIVNIFTQTPNITPSLLNSSAGDATELEKPLMGTMEPAPAKLPILSYTPIPVRKDAKNMMMISV